MILLKSLNDLSFHLACNRVNLAKSLYHPSTMQKGVLHLVSKECHRFIPSSSSLLSSLPSLATVNLRKRTPNLETVGLWLHPSCQAALRQKCKSSLQTELAYISILLVFSITSQRFS